jgi:hypothetical protein
MPQSYAKIVFLAAAGGVGLRLPVRVRAGLDRAPRSAVCRSCFVQGANDRRHPAGGRAAVLTSAADARTLCHSTFEETAMKRLFVTAGALAAFSLIPITAAACEEYDEAMATTTPPASLASAPPAATKVPTATPVAKANVAKTKQAAAKPAPKASDAKVAAATAN